MVFKGIIYLDSLLSSDSEFELNKIRRHGPNPNRGPLIKPGPTPKKLKYTEKSILVFWDKVND